MKEGYVRMKLAQAMHSAGKKLSPGTVICTPARMSQASAGHQARFERQIVHWESELDRVLDVAARRKARREG